LTGFRCGLWFLLHFDALLHRTSIAELTEIQQAQAGGSAVHVGAGNLLQLALLEVNRPDFDFAGAKKEKYVYFRD